MKERNSGWLVVRERKRATRNADSGGQYVSPLPVLTEKEMEIDLLRIHRTPRSEHGAERATSSERRSDENTTCDEAHDAGQTAEHTTSDVDC